MCVYFEILFFNSCCSYNSLLPHKRTADEEAPPISANTDPHFFRTYLNTVVQQLARMRC